MLTELAPAIPTLQSVAAALATLVMLPATLWMFYTGDNVWGTVLAVWTLDNTNFDPIERDKVLITDVVPPEWQPRLPDLRTRIAVTPVTSIGLPDDVLFGALIELQFADRGLHIPGEALRFMVERLERDYWAAERAVEAIDRFAIAERARLSLPTVRRALTEAGLIAPIATEEAG